jgi:hypothetical protein
MKTLVRVHQDGQQVKTVKRVMHLDEKTFDWYIILDKQKVFVYPECDDTADTYGTPYSREAAQTYTYHENCTVIDGDGIVTRCALYWKDGDTSTIWTLDGRQAVFSFTLNAYVIVSQEAQAVDLEAELEGEASEAQTPAQASIAQAVAQAQADEDQWLEQCTEAAMFHQEPPPLPANVACLRDGRERRDILARFQAHVPADTRELEPFTAF